MIVPMKKTTIIVQEKDAKETVADLRKLGLLHVQPQLIAQGADISLLQEDVSLAGSAMEVFQKAGIAPQEEKTKAAAIEDWKAKAKHLIELWKRYEHLEAYSRTLNGLISAWEPWGDFEPREVKEISDKGIMIKLYQVPTNRLAEFPQDVIVHTIRTHAGTSYCLVITQKHLEVPFKEAVLPRQGLSEMRRRLKEDRKIMAEIKDEILKNSVCYQEFLRAREKLHKEIEFFRVVNGMGQEGRFVYVSGYAPQDSMETIRQKAQDKQWGIVFSDPAADEDVPTLIRNPRWISVISPMFKLLEILPGYREMDISLLFLLFLSLFFGMIIGDAGYGVLYILLTFWLSRKFGHKMADKRIFSLLYIFSSFAIFWGLLTGTVFGQEWYLKAGLKPLIPILNDTKFLQAFCFFLGAFHLTLGHGWQALRKLPSLAALVDMGWICVLWAGFFLAKTLILDDPFPVMGKWLIIGGLSLVILCTSPQKNILKMLGSGLGTVALNLMNNFTDVVSYVRLFAVGLAGVAIANTVNTLAASSGNVIAQVMILFIGHTINILLGPISVLVHGVRLNVLEFSGHAGLSWSGLAYKPFKE